MRIRRTTTLRVDNSTYVYSYGDKEKNTVSLCLSNENETFILEFGVGTTSIIKEVLEKLYAAKQNQTQNQLFAIQNEIEELHQLQGAF